MKIVSCNVNGIRSAYKKGLLDFIKSEGADIICFQEIKATKKDLPSKLLNLEGYHPFFNPAEKRGYSGTAVYTREKPLSVNTNLGLDKFDKEGRILELDYPNFTLLNFYIPHGGRNKKNLDYKLEAYKKILRKINKLKDGNTIIIGDFNIAHKENDLARPSQNKDNIMFTQEERRQLDKFSNLGFIDSFRHFNKKLGFYTWWPYAFNARERNLGWRIDYGFVSQKILSKLKSASIYSDILFSDHCPIGLNLA